MKNSRRRFIHTCIGLLSGGWILKSCNSKKTSENALQEEPFSWDSCEDFTGISEGELAKRDQLGYVDKTPIPDNYCSNCQLYIPPKTEDACGGCMLFEGPVYADAYCTYWAPQG